MPTLAELHPVLRQRAFVIQSPPYEEFEAVFEECLRVGELALCMYAPPRAGKTTSQTYLARKLEQARRAVVVSTRIPRQQQPRIDQAEFWSWFLEARQLKPLASSHGRLREQFVNGLRVAADTDETQRVILMCDEGQNLVLQHLALLKALVDELIDKGLSPFVLLVAQPEIQLRPEALRKGNYQDLIDRFFTRWHRLRGLGLGEFEEFIGNYDELRWPQPDGPSFTAHFAGPQVARGWSLRGVAADFRREFNALNKSLGLGELRELETKFLTAAVRLLLTRVQQANADGNTVRMPELIAESVRGSGLIEARRKVGDAEDVIAPKRTRVAA